MSPKKARGSKKNKGSRAPKQLSQEALAEREARQSALRERQEAWERALLSLSAQLGYEQPSETLREALTHRSYVNEHRREGADNQRLEFLGDAILGVACTRLLWERLPSASEGQLSATRARLVNALTLARLAEQLELEACLRVGQGEPNMGPLARQARLADALEAVIGALTLDQGEARARAWVCELLSPELDQLKASLEAGEALLNVKSQLQHLAHERFKVTPRYEREVLEGGGLKVQVWIDDVLWGEAQGDTRRSTEERAASEAFASLQGDQAPSPVEEPSLSRPKKHPKPRSASRAPQKKHPAQAPPGARPLRRRSPPKTSREPT